jgi:hypothetical protein
MVSGSAKGVNTFFSLPFVRYSLPLVYGGNSRREAEAEHEGRPKHACAAPKSISFCCCIVLPVAAEPIHACQHFPTYRLYNMRPRVRVQRWASGPRDLHLRTGTIVMPSR